MARTNKAVKIGFYRRFKARTGRDPTNDELSTLVDLLDAFREVCETTLETYREIPDGPARNMIAPTVLYWSHLRSGLLWIASCVVRVYESNSDVIGICNSRRRGDKRSGANSRSLDA
jgi:hypothetical protein